MDDPKCKACDDRGRYQVGFGPTGRIVDPCDKCKGAYVRWRVIGPNTYGEQKVYDGDVLLEYGLCPHCAESGTLQTGTSLVMGRMISCRVCGSVYKQKR